ncbi:GNAT family N-acetyltransferase [Actinoplanes awajinensis]|uniref:Acetyltransferase n=1 Tax=Actinoplanes awajinensis subsp. mycoplanecinus TaxID=135947 RepID=A0A117MS90_9ACTN|nr:GNAT family N-acetyltransferase [Actinoplanes awajinensis]KUL32996.1 acetyltransferase [Actinoplanes awajinensis subsp. mycoplanecinus]
MSVTMQLATPDALGEIVEAVAVWQHTGGPVQLHPGDLGWHWRFGRRKVAEAVRVWARNGHVLAVGMVDDGVIRMGIAPGVDEDAAFAARLLADLSDPKQGVLPDGTGAVEARFGTALRDLLDRGGWAADEPWTPLSRELIEPVEDCGLRVEVIEAHDVRDRIVDDRVAVQRAAFANSAFTVERWRAMAAAPPYRRARCLVGYDGDGDAVAAVTAWSAGEGRPGLLEPLGVHRDHRGHGYGRAITVAAAAALQRMGSSSATVCTPSSNVGAVATYVSAGFQKFPEVTDFRRTS